VSLHSQSVSNQFGLKAQQFLAPSTNEYFQPNQPCSSSSALLQLANAQSLIIFCSCELAELR